MRGYDVGCGYMGWMPDTKKYELFETEDEYVEMFKERNPYRDIIWID